MSLKKDKDKEKEKEKQSEAESKGKAAENDSPQEGASAENVQEEAPIKMVMLPAEDVEKLKEEAGRNLENWQRERADFMNYKKRIERDQQQLSARITGDIIKKYLPVLDDIERAIKAIPATEREVAWLEGIELICRKLQKILESEGIVKIPAERFDPARHEAITYEASPNHESGEIIEIVQQGYMLGDRVLRPAQVRVAQ